MDCQYDNTFTCWRPVNTCPHRRFMDCLKSGIIELTIQLATANTKLVQRENLLQTKVQYWKSKCNEARLSLKKPNGYQAIINKLKGGDSNEPTLL